MLLVFGSLSDIYIYRVTFSCVAGIVDPPVMRSFGNMMLYWLLPLTAHCWWCETSAVTGCVGHPRHFVLEGSANAHKFEAGICNKTCVGHVFVEMTSDSGVARKLAVLGQKSREQGCSGSVANI